MLDKLFVAGMFFYSILEKITEIFVYCHDTSSPIVAHFRLTSGPLPTHFRPTPGPLPAHFRPTSSLITLLSLTVYTYAYVLNLEVEPTVYFNSQILNDEKCTLIFDAKFVRTNFARGCI